MAATCLSARSGSLPDTDCVCLQRERQGLGTGSLPPKGSLFPSPAARAAARTRRARARQSPRRRTNR
eukprot:652529-Pyramimonas_sp.AAC.1